MTEEWLKEFEAATNAATKGPWRRFASGKTVEVQLGDSRALIRWNGFDSSDTPVAQQRRNALFIAMAREGVPALFAELRRLREATRCRGASCDE